MILSMDNFEIYVTPSDATLDVDSLGGRYIVDQSTTTGLAIREVVGRTVLGNIGTQTGRRGVYVPMYKHLVDHDNITINQKLVQFTPSVVAVGGVGLSDSTGVNDLLVFGFNTAKSGFVRYVDVDNVVREEGFILPTSLGLEQDTIEWSFSKTSEDPNDYGTFVLWVNNKSAYVGTILSQQGSKSALVAKILGGGANKAVGSSSVDKVVSTGGNVTIPAYGTTDVVTTSGERLGQIRVSSRAPTADVGPNSMLSTEAGVGHWSVIGNVPYDANKYLTAVSSAMEEMYGSRSFTDLSSENVLAMGLTFVASKNNPFSMDLQGLVKVGSTSYPTDTIDVDLVAGFSDVIMERNPETGLSWTPLEANSAHFGMRVI